jgi:hypothetical protein
VCSQGKSGDGVTLWTMNGDGTNATQLTAEPVAADHVGRCGWTSLVVPSAGRGRSYHPGCDDLHLDAGGEQRLHRALRRFWHPVARAAEPIDEAIPRSLYRDANMYGIRAVESCRARLNPKSTVRPFAVIRHRRRRPPLAPVGDTRG